MATQTLTETAAQPALLFMPDISGFTEFVSNNEIIHAQSIIQEVLEILIESNNIQLEVQEIEGDAIFFYRVGLPPSVEELLQQIQVMFSRFHQHLQLYERQRICPCGACTSAANLKLKIIAHFGEVTGYSVKKHQKLFGRDVIVVHRLLKNNLNSKEYALMTLPLLNGAKPPEKFPDWFMPEEASENYDVGEIRFQVSDLTKLREQLPPPQITDLRLSGKAKQVFTVEDIIPAPPADVFGAIFDISQRPQWMEGVKQIEMVTKDLINRVGTMHRCITDSKNNPVLVTEYAHIGDGKAVLVEMERKGLSGCRFTVQQEGEAGTRLTIDMLIKNNPLLLAFFNLFMKNKLRSKLTKSITNLSNYCRQHLAQTDASPQ
jgi:carbon monoxide dehydrogenase subunit G